MDEKDEKRSSEGTAGAVHRKIEGVAVILFGILVAIGSIAGFSITWIIGIFIGLLGLLQVSRG